MSDRSPRRTPAVAGARAWEVVLQRIEGDLEEGRLHPGDHLPPERELSATLGVGRSSVREALRVLEVMGLIRTTTGSGPSAGAIIIARPNSGMATLLRLQSAAQAFGRPDVVEARIVFEAAVASSLARRVAADPENAADVLRGPREELAAMGAEGLSATDFLTLDARFHLMLAEASENTVMVAVMAGLRGAIESYFLQGATVIEDWPATAARLTAEHEGILDAVASGDPVAAAARVTAHIQGYVDQISP